MASSMVNVLDCMDGLRVLAIQDRLENYVGNDDVINQVVVSVNYAITKEAIT